MAIGGQGTIATDGTTAGRNVPDGAPSFLVGAGPCLRWPRLRASLTLDGAVRVKSIAALAATEVMWIFLEGHARSWGGRTRTSLAAKGRLAGGWNGITNRRIVEAGIGLAVVLDSARMRRLVTERFPQQTGDFHAVSLDLIATYAPDRVGEDEVWLGAQLSFHLNGLSSPPPVSGGTRVGSYGQYRAPEPGQSTDCNGGHLP
ncbi:MAG: hypothetical protein KBG48_02545 [Kofleriaceae bacterium]|nr:hypothetical protein [Kofleriaceae bacterium]MBP9166230.1 hypothetical protein [Kofleriaceae bacterium]